MQPRFEVIETYPKSKFKKGDILERIPNATNDWYNADKSLINADILLEEIEQYPHLFRKLNWWEKNYHLFDDVVASYHPEFADKDNFFKVAEFLQDKINYLCLRMMMLEDKFDDMINLGSEVKQRLNA